jgi:hypothetical protein
MTDIPKLWMDGAFNHADPWFNIPLYIWGLALWWIILIPVWWYLLKMLKWDKFVKFHGLHYAKKNDSAAVIIADFMGEADMIAENKAKCIFDYSQDDYEVTIPDVPLNIIKIVGVIVAVLGIACIWKVNVILGIILITAGIIAYCIERVLPWLVSTLFFYPTHYLKDISWNEAVMYKIGGINYDCKIAQILQGGEWDRYPVVICGGIPVELIYDTDQWCKKNSVQNKAIKKFAKQWNLDHPTDQIHTFSKLQRYHDEGMINDEDIPGVSFEYIVPWVRIDSGFPYYPKSDYEGKLRQMAQLKNKERDASTPLIYLILIIAAGVVALLGILAVRGFMKWMAMPK